MCSKKTNRKFAIDRPARHRCARPLRLCHRCAGRTQALAGRGFGILEIVIALALISLSLFALVNVLAIASRAVDESIHQDQAAFLLEEGFEAAKIIRDSGWSNISFLALNTPYYLVFSGGAWQFTATPQTIDGIFQRTVVFGPVFRDENDNIAASGTEDVNSRKITIGVSWNERGVARNIEAVSYITNLFLE